MGLASDKAAGVEEVPPTGAEPETRLGDHRLVDPHRLARRDGRVGAEQLQVATQARGPALDVGVDQAEEVAVVARASRRVECTPRATIASEDTSMGSTKKRRVQSTWPFTTMLKTGCTSDM
jgi:hypothetical protein